MYKSVASAAEKMILVTCVALFATHACSGLLLQSQESKDLVRLYVLVSAFCKISFNVRA